jgi:hypothetical protein
MRAERELEEVEVALWGVPQAPVDAPSGAAAAFAIVAFLSFATGLGLAALFLL